MVTAKYEQEVQKKKKGPRIFRCISLYILQGIGINMDSFEFLGLIVLNNSVKVQCLFIIISFIFFTPCLIFIMLTR